MGRSGAGRATAAAIILGLAATSAAGAMTSAAGAASDRRAHFSASTEAIQYAYALAVGYWHRTPCGGTVAFAWSDAPGSRMATAYWTSDRSGDPDHYWNCRIVLHRESATDWPRFCTIVVHEVGHLTGHGHVRDRSSVMYPFYVGPRGPCTRPQPTPATSQPAPQSTPPPSPPPDAPTPSAPPPPPAPQQPGLIGQLLGGI